MGSGSGSGPGSSSKNIKIIYLKIVQKICATLLNVNLAQFMNKF